MNPKTITAEVALRDQTSEFFDIDIDVGDNIEVTDGCLAITIKSPFLVRMYPLDTVKYVSLVEDDVTDDL